MNVLVLGDVGGPFHLGDDAMLEAAMAALPHHRWTVLSNDPASTRARYGVKAVRQLGLSTDARLEELVAAAHGEKPLSPDDPALDVLDAVAAADAVLIAGGGNLASGWTQQVYERAALAALALARSKPLVVTGQGLGPHLTKRDGELVASVLTSAQLVGVRSRTSAQLAKQLGVPAQRVWTNHDDAMFVPAAEHDSGHVAVSLSPHHGLVNDPAEAWAGLLDHLVELTGLDVLLVPNAPEDVAHHEALLTHVKSRRVRQVEASAAPFRSASLVLSNRHHPVVFALSAAVPSVGIATDDYTEAKIAGSLALQGLEGWCASVLGLENGLLADAVDEAWARRTEISEHLLPRTAHAEAAAQRWWRAVDAALHGRPVPAQQPDVDLTEVRPDGAWAERSADALRWSRMLGARDLAWQQEREDLALAARRATEELRAERQARRAAHDETTELLETLAVERAAGDVARAKNAELLDRDRALVSELEAMRATKVWRWTRGLRRAYGASRRTDA